MLTGPTLVFARESLDAMRVIATLRAKDIDIKYVPSHEATELLAAIPEAPLPCLLDRGLVCYGAPLDNLIHERHPAPNFLPDTPLQRAQLRMLTKEVRGWYDLSDGLIEAKLKEVSDAYEHSPFYFSRAISIFDWALAPLLHRAVVKGLNVYGDRLFKAYAQRILKQPAFLFAVDLVA